MPHHVGPQDSHYVHRSGWLRAFVLGANDGIVSTASLILGVYASGASHQVMVVSGVAALVAGAMSMAAGEYVSVSSQADSEQADIDREKRHLEEHPVWERRELVQIYRDRGLNQNLAEQVADELMAKDALAAHVRDELGITDVHAARPLTAAVASAVAFTMGGGVPLAVLSVVSQNFLAWLISTTLVLLVALGMVSSRIGGAPVWKGAIRILFWSSLAMALTFIIGKQFDVG